MNEKYLENKIDEYTLSIRMCCQSLSMIAQILYSNVATVEAEGAALLIEMTIDRMEKSYQDFIRSKDADINIPEESP